MAFVLKQSGNYSWPVKVDLPEEGKLRRHTFEIVFKNISQSRFQEMINQSQSGELNDVDVCREVVEGWSGILDEKGEEMPFVQKKFDELLEVLGIPTAIATAFIESRIGGAKRKN
tara:strand:- start:2682 stop:3026 length:345 start_codon:yes stop_codon:yes gene_type:complete